MEWAQPGQRDLSLARRPPRDSEKPASWCMGYMIENCSMSCAFNNRSHINSSKLLVFTALHLHILFKSYLRIMKISSSLFITVIGAIATITNAVEFEIVNKEIGAVWVGIQGNAGKPHLENGGFVLEAGARRTIHAPEDWAGRFWGRTWCDYNSKHCITGDCGNKLECRGAGGVPPVTLAEITLKGWGGIDYYDISLVDGFNLAMSMTPVNGQGDGSRYSCKRTACLRHLNDDCPGELRKTTEHGTVACHSACNKFNTDQYCCRNAHNRPETCRSSSWPKDYPKFFKDRCPDAYSYAYDDHKSTFTCKASKYIVQIGI
ncbi:unnamed protein product [Phyllotreta striolata]|uniref:Pathogenesis-related protein 5-like n=1 Tax=Phyllotreta striolata TaxID=444603 RepID=A0A9N9TG96_PHYSR|nr:unnamed protein product [Phyllotreta striolata]